MRTRHLIAALAALLIAGPATSQEPARLAATTLEGFAAPEALQGAAVDDEHFYAIANRTIAKYRKSNGARLMRRQGPADWPITHLNSCFAAEGQLICANSNYPETPMASSVEIFDAITLEHVATKSLGIMDEGSLTWFDRLDTGYVAAFAHYDGAQGGVAHKGHRATGLVLFDDAWRRQGGWMFPSSVLDRLAPASVSGGQLGPDGLLYVLGHDKPEMYVLARPTAGPKLIHLATIAIEARGQAFAWDRSDPDRIVFAIDRQRREVRRIAVPPVPIDHPYAARFE